MKSTEEFWSKRQHTDSSAMESWILSRQNDLVMGKVFFTFIFHKNKVNDFSPAGHKYIEFNY